MDGSLLKSKMALHKDTGNTLSSFLGISANSFSNKITGKTDFTQSEMEKIKEKYHLTPEEIDAIFF